MQGILFLLADFALGCACLSLAFACKSAAFTSFSGGALCRSIFLGLAVCSLVKREDILVDHAVIKIYDSGGIDGDTEITGLEVEVRTGGTSGVTTERNRIAGLNDLIGFHKETGEVTVDGLHSVVMTHNDIVAIAAGLILGETDLSRECCANGITYMEVHVNAVVHAAETGAITVAGGHDTSHRGNILTDIDILMLGDGDGSPVGVYTLRSPELGVDLGIGGNISLFTFTNLVEEDVIVLDLEGVDRGLLIGEQGVVLAGMRCRESALGLC